MKGIHKLIVTLLLLITFVDTSPTKTKPTLITLKLNSSEIVNDSEGRKSFERLKPSNLFFYISQDQVQARLRGAPQVRDTSAQR